MYGIFSRFPERRHQYSILEINHLIQFFRLPYILMIKEMVRTLSSVTLSWEGLSFADECGELIMLRAYHRAEDG